MGWGIICWRPELPAVAGPPFGGWILGHPLTFPLTHHITVVGPGAELHETCLLIEGKVFDINFAKGFVNGGRFPHHFARVMKNCFCHYCHFIVAIGAARKKMV